MHAHIVLALLRERADKMRPDETETDEPWQQDEQQPFADTAQKCVCSAVGYNLFRLLAWKL